MLRHTIEHEIDLARNTATDACAKAGWMGAQKWKSHADAVIVAMDPLVAYLYRPWKPRAVPLQ